jgi:hypothetical protein
MKEFKSQKEAEKHYKEEGWDIIHPKLTVDRSKCNHIWEKIKKNDWQCKKCRQGFIGNPNEKRTA